MLFAMRRKNNRRQKRHPSSTATKFADDIKLSGMVDMPEGWDAAHVYLDKFETQAHVNLGRFSKVKC